MMEHLIKLKKVVEGVEALNPFTQSDHDELDGSGETVTQVDHQQKPKPAAVPAAPPAPPQSQVDNPEKKVPEKSPVPSLPLKRASQSEAESTEGSPSNEEAAPVSASQTEPVQPQAQTQQQQQQPEGSGTEIPGFLYKVRAAYRYVAEDDDELSFEKGEIINVVEFEDPEEQDEGWLLGILELSGIKGVFPANFTKKI
ncbi:myc box-dependent-interacting protein 1-like [Stylophora pistillata]|uniref:myc box-dependent-interacting protein 1-like n=1 Tax=Stylophora pistillata TaxID=50429 RepID=UPI000C04D29E|nr:myc box-dependent-interacting protein 1-like [Stylophora pistillata]